MYLYIKPAPYSPVRLMSDIFEGVNQETGEIVAIKTATEDWEINTNEEKKVLRKIKALGSDNYNIVKFYEDFYYKTKQYLVFTEDIVGGGLLLSDIRVIAQQVLVALNFLHRNGMAHRDLKPNNIMLVDRSSLKVKLIDMGFTEEIERMENIRCNPLLYMPPEEIMLIKPDSSVDMWCLALTLIFLYIGEHLFDYDSMEETMLKSLDDLMTIRPPTKDPIEREDLLSFIDLLKQMLVSTPQERITSAAALKHSFITMDHFSDFNSNSSYVLEAYEAMRNHTFLTAELMGLTSLHHKGIISNFDEFSTNNCEAQSSSSDNINSVTSGNYDPPIDNVFHAKTRKIPESLPVSSVSTKQHSSSESCSTPGGGGTKHGRSVSSSVRAHIGRTECASKWKYSSWKRISICVIHSS
uniref:Protein kinase domain-containing protein n=1 Tax=Cyprinodon variegatus TaxID=28743 RepID=A0A3Q2CZT8_CYPVA